MLNVEFLISEMCKSYSQVREIPHAVIILIIGHGEDRGSRLTSSKLREDKEAPVSAFIKNSTFMIVHFNIQFFAIFFLKS